jgi:hypothetical protein
MRNTCSRRCAEQVEVDLVAGRDRPEIEVDQPKPSLSSGWSVATIRDRTAALSNPRGLGWLDDLDGPRQH